MVAAAKPKPKARPASVLRSFTIERTGEFELPVTGLWHCGPKASVKPRGRDPGTVTVRFTVRCECAPVLDPHGFLFDQAAVARWMVEVTSTPTDMSCERLCHHLGDLFLRHLARVSPDCVPRRLTLTLSPDPFAASISADWEVDPF